MIQILVAEVKSSIIIKIKQAKFFIVILDFTPNANHGEQMSLIIQRVDHSVDVVTVEEFWLSFLKVNDTSGIGLFKELQNVLINLELDIDDIRGQGYDNGSNMKMRYKGVQIRLLEVNPRTFYTVFGCHSLNLPLCDMVTCSKTMSFFGVIQRICILFFSYTKRWQIFKNHVKGFTVKSLSYT